MSNDRTDGARGRAARLLVVLVAAIVVTSPLTAAAVATPTAAESREESVDRPASVPSPPADARVESQQETRQIGSCTAITEPGRYELTGDVTDDTSEVCIHVRASDVVLDGNNHTIAGGDANDSVGVLVYNGTQGAPVTRNETLSSVTVQDVGVTGWERGVVVGDIAGIDTEAHLEDVVARDNTETGVRLTEAEDGSLENVTATGNRDGLSFWEVSGFTAENVTASDNDQLGFGLYQNVRNNTFRNVTATGNGPVGYASAGIYLSTDVTENVIEDAYVANNDGAGVRFSDSARNVLRDTVVESNANRGLFGDRASDERLQNVTVRGNGGPEVELTDGGLDADGLHLGEVATLSFRDEPAVLEPFDTGNLTTPPPGTTPADRGVELSNVRDQVTVTFDYDTDAVAVLLWRYDGEEWVQVSDAAVNRSANTVTGNVSGNGLVVPTTSAVESGAGDGTTTGGVWPTTADSEGPAADGGTSERGTASGAGEQTASGGQGVEGGGSSATAATPADVLRQRALVVGTHLALGGAPASVTGS